MRVAQAGHSPAGIAPAGAAPAGIAQTRIAQTRIGVVVPHDMALDRELWRWVPDDVSLLLTRTPPPPPEVRSAVGIEMITAISESEVVASATKDLVGTGAAVYAYACTSGSFARGLAGERKLVRAMRAAGAPEVVTTSGALLAALAEMGVTRVAVATPYDEVLTAGLADFLLEAGVRVTGSAQLGLSTGIWAVPYETTADLVRRADSDEAEAVVVSCTNLATYDLIAPLEAELGKPVVTANQATMWASLRALGRAAVGPGQRLLGAGDRARGNRAPRPVTEPTTRGYAATTAGANAGAGTGTETDAAEYDARLARVRQEMARRSLSALVVSDPANLFYLCGYDAWSFYTPQCLVLPADGEPQLFARAMDAAGASFTTALPPGQVHGYPEDLVHRPDGHPFEWITARARESGALDGGRDAVVAVEGDSHFFSPRAYLALVAGLPPDGQVVDSAELVNWVRLVKSPTEVARLRIAGTIAERVMRVALDGVAVGRRQCDVAAEIVAAQAAGTAEHGGDYAAFVPLLPTGDAAGTPHLTWTERRFAAGEATTIELAGVYGRYHTPLARTVMLGEPAPRLARTAAVVREGMAEALAAMVPGATGHDVHAAFTAVISRAGLRKDSRIGYSIGIGYPPDWGERTVSLRPGERTVLGPGMAFHVILGMWMDGWGYELSEPVVVTDSGVERLTDLPQDLTTKR